MITDRSSTYVLGKYTYQKFGPIFSPCLKHSSLDLTQLHLKHMIGIDMTRNLLQWFVNVGCCIIIWISMSPNFQNA
jgi:hypothetical protein